MRPSAPLILALLGLAVVAARGSEPDFRDRYRRPTAIVPAPANAAESARVELGRLLFFDPRLSGTGAISCATCHNPSFAWSDALPTARGEGHRPLPRRTPTIINAAFNPLQMWDGRFATLEEQAAGPLLSRDEMNMVPAVALARLAAAPRYRELFRLAFPDSGLSFDTVARALAAFERTVVSGEAPFDRFVAGDDEAISAAARRGFVLFNTKARCSSCHSGWNFSDGSFHDIGVAGDDLGRGPILGFAELDHAFKTPTLREVSLHAPYMHNGSEASLASVIELYNRGGRAARPTLSREIQPLALSPAEVDDLLAFLQTLTSEMPPVTLPDLPATESPANASTRQTAARSN